MFHHFLRPPRRVGGNNAAQLAQFTALSRYLHEPDSGVQRMLRRNRSYLDSVNRLRFCRQRRADLDRHLASFRFEQSEAFAELQRHYPGSRILVSYHFGDFIYGSNVVAGHETPGRQQYFLTQHPCTDAFLSNMRHCFGKDGFSDRTQITSTAVAPVALVRKLRTETCSLLTFVDLPSGFGERTRVRFLGRDAWFPKGPAVLSLASGAPILPVLNFKAGKTNHVQLFPLLEARKYPGETLAQTSTRLTQNLVTILEHALQRYPWQWRFLSLLPAYYEFDSPNRNNEIEARSHYDNGCQTSSERFSEIAAV